MTTPGLEEKKSIAPLLAVGLAVTSMIIWSTPPVIARAMSAGVPPVALAFSRWILASLILLPFVWKKLPAEWPHWKLHWKPLLLLSSFMIAGSSLSVVAVYFTTATNAVLVNASQPAITAFITFLVVGERLRMRQGIGVACAFFGIMVMICRADWAVIRSLDINIGDLIMLSAVVGWSFYAVFVHRRKYTPRPEILLFLISIVGTVILLPMYLVEASIVGGFELQPSYAAAMIYLAVFPTLLATHFWNQAIHSLGANQAAIFINLIPIFGAVLAMVFLGERLFSYHLIGAAFVFVGIFFAVRRGA